MNIEIKRLNGVELKSFQSSFFKEIDNRTEVVFYDQEIAILKDQYNSQIKIICGAWASCEKKLENFKKYGMVHPYRTAIVKNGSLKISNKNKLIGNLKIIGNFEVKLMTEKRTAGNK